MFFSVFVHVMALKRVQFEEFCSCFKAFSISGASWDCSSNSSVDTLRRFRAELTALLTRENNLSNEDVETGFSRAYGLHEDQNILESL